MTTRKPATNIGALLRGVQRNEIERGQVLCKPGTINPHTKFHGQVYVLSKEEGGRHTPFFNNYRPQFYFRTTDVTGVISLPEGTEMCMPGDNVEMDVELITPIAIEEGLRFAIREGGRTVGSGVCHQDQRLICRWGDLYFKGGRRERSALSSRFPFCRPADGWRKGKGPGRFLLPGAGSRRQGKGPGFPAPASGKYITALGFSNAGAGKGIGPEHLICTGVGCTIQKAALPTESGPVSVPLKSQGNRDGEFKGNKGDK